MKTASYHRFCIIASATLPLHAMSHTYPFRANVFRSSVRVVRESSTTSSRFTVGLAPSLEPLAPFNTPPFRPRADCVRGEHAAKRSVRGSSAAPGAALRTYTWHKFVCIVLFVAVYLLPTSCDGLAFILGDRFGSCGLPGWGCSPSERTSALGPMGTVLTKKSFPPSPPVWSQSDESGSNTRTPARGGGAGSGVATYGARSAMEGGGGEAVVDSLIPYDLRTRRRAARYDGEL
eukprot:CAMPEP_0119480450 /NCGR_PEP_ID=MMETSP1344-20130328/9251_1 /TAXON_ID=236787 /ORGANISM="Florenciella parvula, Strain CCMP2471" /LENGTH=232 /DNA_ID=CAMNT_0007514759 /DNA_START=1788 /DNA_END=2486 /DNA_ORIENTATION=-